MTLPTFRSDFAASLPQESGSAMPIRDTPHVFSMRVLPTRVQAPSLLCWSDSVAHLLGFPSSPQKQVEEITSILSGNSVPPGASPYATRYGGHQFGHWAGQLGDGRAIALGEIRTSDGLAWEIQLKGAGRTPYSRRGDGRAVLRSSLREYLCSEAMHHLGIPTTRALSCVLTGEPVIRDMFYDGNPEQEPGAITSRVAQSFLRFGHFQILAASGETELLRKLVVTTLDRYFPGHSASSEEGLVRWFTEVADRTAQLMVDWLRVGFVHGVMNTDNMSILGLTIDYGPYGWLDVYDPNWTPNTTDSEQRRYRYTQQPSIALWNLSRLAEALAPLFQDPQVGLKMLTSGLESFQKTFRAHYLEMMQSRLGIETLDNPEGYELLENLEQNLQRSETDATLFYRSLGSISSFDQLHSDSLWEVIQNAFYQAPEQPEVIEPWKNWLSTYAPLRRRHSKPWEQVQKRMNELNPVFILRNFIVQEVLDALEKGDRAPLDQVATALRTPYEWNSLTSPFHRKLPDWARSRPGCSALSCSS